MAAEGPRSLGQHDCILEVGGVRGRREAPRITWCGMMEAHLSLVAAHISLGLLGSRDLAGLLSRGLTLSSCMVILTAVDYMMDFAQSPKLAS